MCREEADLPPARDGYEDTAYYFGMNMTDDFKLKTLYENCSLCPRNCGVNRLSGSLGVCRESAKLYVSRAALHMWEEPCISGSEGSGAVFFSGCNMHCVFCQNHDISNGDAGKEITVQRLSEIFLELQRKGANNINLVTPTHYLPHILTAIDLAKEKGLTLPFVYNTSGYESVQNLELLKDYVSVFLPDFKYMKEDTAFKFSKAKDYPDIAKEAIKKMVEIAGIPEFDSNTGIIKKGVIVRVLVLPEHTNEAISIIKYLYDTFKDDIYISIMSQYTPLSSQIPDGKDFECLKRSITRREYEKVINAALDMGVKNAFFQDGSVNLESFIPAFDCEGV